MSTVLSVDFQKPKGVTTKKRILVVDGVEHEMQWGVNTVTVEAGRHEVSAYLRAPIGNKIAKTKPLTVEAADVSKGLIYHGIGGLLTKQFRLEIKGQEAPPPAPLAAWAWPFVIACIAIPVVALGGAVPVVLGILGSGACVGLAKADKLPLAVRILASLAVTAAAWTIFILVVRAVAG